MNNDLLDRQTNIFYYSFLYNREKKNEHDWYNNAVNVAVTFTNNSSNDSFDIRSRARRKE